MGTTQKRRPNFLIIVADDLGFSDVGCFGGEINTPNLDSLAGEGVRFLNYHTAAACSPTRAMLLTGTDAHLCGLGCLIEHKKSPEGAKRWNGKSGYEGFLNKDVATLAEILQDNGYHTILSGKWHLGLRPEYGPHSRGFDKSFSMLPGCSNHYGWEPQLENGFTGMPIGGRPIHTEDGKKYQVTPNKTEDPKGFYSSDTYTDKLIEYLGARTEEERAKPFLAYYAFSAPHWPNQSPKAIRDKYKSVYSDGPDALRLRRLARMAEIGIISPDVKAHDVIAPQVAEWDDMTEYERACSARSMAAYAGMVEQMDYNIGRTIQHLKDTGEYENTFILFQSDNGAEGAAIEAAPVMGAKVLGAIKLYYDNSLENIGAWNSYTWIGPRWAQASTAPSRLMKAFPSQGGILVPCIVKAPQFKTNYSIGGFSRAFSTCMDIAPTILDILDIQMEKTKDGSKMKFRGNEVHAPRGISWMPFYVDGKSADVDADEIFGVHASTEVFGWEMLARAALRQGRWKIVHLPKLFGGVAEPGNDDGWELFDVVADPGETTNLAAQHPEKLNQLLELWENYVMTTQVIWGANAHLPGLSKDDHPLLYEDDMELQRNWIQTPIGGTPTASAKASE